MTYKHGNWSCKPANEAEAREIVKRAVASGAELVNKLGDRADYVYPWDFYGVWGVYDSRTATGKVEWGKQYTIEQVREMFPLPGEHAEQSWNGEGLPPVGVECEMFFEVSWIPAKIIGTDGSALVAKLHIKRNGFTEVTYRACHSCKFRPIRSERERWVEESSKVFHGACMHDYSGQHFALAMGAVYDALKSGDLKAPEVE